MIENAILSHLIENENYARKVLPYIKAEYFTTNSNQLIYEAIKHYVDKYNALPSKEALQIDIDNIKDLNETLYKESMETLQGLAANAATDADWLLDQTEKYCQDRAVYNAIKQSIVILDGKTKQTKEAIPELLSTALSVSFDTSIGHSFFDDARARYEYYHQKVQRIPFDIDYLNRITRGGVERKSLNIILGGTGIGKTLMMCHMAAANLAAGHNVLYITLEMSEHKIAQRIETNLMNVTVDDLEIMPWDIYSKKLNKIQEKTKGKLVIKEYPTTSAGAANFRHLLQELKTKQNFTPDIIYIDYLNICCSSRIKMGANGVNTYVMVKAIAEELRGLAVEFNLPIISATQTNRDGINSSDLDLTNTAESIGLPQTCDLMFGIISTEELEAMGQLLVKQLKNRYNDVNKYKCFIIGIDRSKMRLYDADESAQKDVHDGPVMDNTEYGERYEEQTTFRKANNKKDFSKFS